MFQFAAELLEGGDLDASVADRVEERLGAEAKAIRARWAQLNVGARVELLRQYPALDALNVAPRLPYPPCTQPVISRIDPEKGENSRSVGESAGPSGPRLHSVVVATPGYQPLPPPPTTNDQLPKATNSRSAKLRSVVVVTPGYQPLPLLPTTNDDPPKAPNNEPPPAKNEELLPVTTDSGPSGPNGLVGQVELDDDPFYPDWELDADGESTRVPLPPVEEEPGDGVHRERDVVIDGSESEDYDSCDEGQLAGPPGGECRER